MTSFVDQLQSALGPGYEVEVELAGGGMSRVFKATELALGRKVVVKVLPPELAAGVNRERFRREIQLAAQLQHPHIVPVLAAGESGNLLYYTMPYIEGESLRDALRRGKRYTVREVVRTLHDILDALAYAHGRGVIHRDIKPGNILTLGSHALVTDFGVAKAISASLPVAGVTTSGMAIGTPAYMAPEQLAGDPAADHRLDLYAVGLLAYELLTGQAPFTEASPQALMAAQLTRDPPPMDRVRADIPQGLSAIVTQCLAKNADDRPASADAVLADLDALSGPQLAVSGGGGRGATITAPVAAPPEAPVRSRWQTRVAVGVVLFVLAGGIGASFAAWRVRSANRERATLGLIPSDSVRGQTVPANVPSAPAVPIAAPLTRADSLAIASAVRRQMAQSDSARRPVPPTTAALARLADSIRQVVQQAVIDSVTRIESERIAALNRAAEQFAGVTRDRTPRRAGEVVVGTAPVTRVEIAPPARGAPGVAPGMAASIDEATRAARAAASAVGMATTLAPTTVTWPRRVMILEPQNARSRPWLAEASRAVADSLARVLASKKGRYVPIDRDSVEAAQQQTRSTLRLAEMLKPDVVVSIGYYSWGDTAIVLQINLRDLTAVSTASYRVAMAGVTTRSAPLAGLDNALFAAASQLEAMSRAPRDPRLGAMPDPRAFRDGKRPTRVPPSPPG